MVAVLCLTAGGEALALRIAAALGGTAQGRAGRTALPETFDDTVEHVRALFAAGVPVVGICAAGILVRAVAPLLADKRAEPPVIAVAEDGSAVVPLLGGHRGANRLARQVAELLGVSAAVTTGGDVALGVALDDPPPGWRLADPEAAKSVMAGLLAGEPYRLSGRADWLAPVAALPTVSAAPGEAVVLAPQAGGPALEFHATRFALGVGCARDCPEEELSALAEAALAEAGVTPQALAGVFSLDLKADEPAVWAMAARLGVPARFFDAARLEAETPRLATPSDVVFAEVGCHGVAEAAALAAAGVEAQLVLPKRKSAMATCAVAAAPGPITALPGRPRGRLSIVGIGPGAADVAHARGLAAGRRGRRAGRLWSLPRPAGAAGGRQAAARLSAGRRGGALPLRPGTRRRGARGCADFLRRRRHLRHGGAGLGAAGRRRASRPPRAGSRWSTAPGISALQAAAARVGAPLGHDFCAVSLSDLLTPREDILRRVRAAAEGDFVVAFYNPVSLRRRELFPLALQILGRHRPPDAPVVLASNLGRPGERVTVRRLRRGDGRRGRHADGRDRRLQPLAHASPRGRGPRVHPARLRREARAGGGMTVHFIGAGPGDPELITVRGLKLIGRCPGLPLSPAAWCRARSSRRRRRGRACSTRRR